MTKIKTEKQIEIMRKGGQILEQVLKKVLSQVEAGVSLSYLDKLAEEEIKKRGAQPSFKTVPGYKWSLCICVNSQVVHGVPKNYKLEKQDILGIDCGVYYQGYHTDAAWTIKVGKATKSEQQFLDAGEKALLSAIKSMKIGNYIWDISYAIQKAIEENSYSVAKALVGHGIGRNLHEEPDVPCFAHGSREQTPEIVSGMVLAIEVIYNKGSSEVNRADDGWTIETQDGTISGLFEATVAATSQGLLVLADPDSISKKVKQF